MNTDMISVVVMAVVLVGVIAVQVRTMSRMWDVFTAFTREQREQHSNALELINKTFNENVERINEMAHITYLEDRRRREYDIRQEMERRMMEVERFRGGSGSGSGAVEHAPGYPWEPRPRRGETSTTTGEGGSRGGPRISSEDQQPREAQQVTDPPFTDRSRFIRPLAEAAVEQTTGREELMEGIGGGGGVGTGVAREGVNNTPSSIPVGTLMAMNAEGRLEPYAAPAPAPAPAGDEQERRR